MRKIPCLFRREFHGHNSSTLLREAAPGCEWVLEGLGKATRKRDGTACLVRGGKLFKRYDAKNGKPAPPAGIPCDPAPDPVTGHWPHWIPVGDEPSSKWYRLAFGDGDLPDGTYELCGPHFSPAEALAVDEFFPHGGEPLIVEDRSFSGIRRLLEETYIEGIVFWSGGLDDPMAKIRREDFGFSWKPGRR